MISTQRKKAVDSIAIDAPTSFSFDPVSWKSTSVDEDYSTYSPAVRKRKTSIALQGDLGAVGFY